MAEPADPGGFCRTAVAADEDLLTEWMVAFAAAIDEPWDDEQARSTVQRTTAAGDFVVWEREGEVVSTAGINRRTPWSSTVALVYTPPHLRGRGYASAVVAALSRRELARGRRVGVALCRRRQPDHQPHLRRDRLPAHRHVPAATTELG